MPSPLRNTCEERRAGSGPGSEACPNMAPAQTGQVGTQHEGTHRSTPALAHDVLHFCQCPEREGGENSGSEADPGERRVRVSGLRVHTRDGAGEPAPGKENESGGTAWGLGPPSAPCLHF